MINLDELTKKEIDQAINSIDDSELNEFIEFFKKEQQIVKQQLKSILQDKGVVFQRKTIFDMFEQENVKNKLDVYFCFYDSKTKKIETIFQKTINKRYAKKKKNEEVEFFVIEGGAIGIL